MKYRPVETVVLSVSVVKWVIIAVGVGILVGALTSFFLMALDWTGEHIAGIPRYYFGLPAALILCSLLIRRMCPAAAGHGTEKVIKAIHQDDGLIALIVIPVKLLATILTIAFGGSVGKEGPAAQMGAGLAAWFAGLLRVNDDDRKKIVVCGISASFAAVFGTPFGGAIFGVEVLFVGSVMYAMLLPSVIAGVTAYKVTSLLGVSHADYLFVAEHPVIVLGEINLSLFAWSILAGVFFGVCAIVFAEMLDGAEKLVKRLPLQTPRRELFGGILLIVMALLFSTDYLGLGVQTINITLEGKSVVWYAFILKMIFTAITLGSGGSGGLVTPLFFIGVTAGSAFARLWGLDPQLFAALGLTAVLAGATNTPLACSLIAIELMGRQIAPYAAIVCVISFLITGYRSVYPSQVLAIIKSSSMEAEVGKEMAQIEPVYAPRRRSLVGFFFLGYRLIRQWIVSLVRSKKV